MARRRPRVFKKVRISRWFQGIFWTIIAFGVMAGLLFFIYLLPTPLVTEHYEHARPPIEEPGSFAPPSVQPVRPALPQPIQPPAQPSKPSPYVKEKPSPLLKKIKPEVAILIDDMGYDQRLDNAMLAIDAPISFAFLPDAPNTEKLAKKAAHMGRDVLVHLPLEPLDPHINPGPGALRISMTTDAILAMLKKDLDSVPDARGVNNHMGSKFTADRKAMELILNEIKRRGLFLWTVRPPINRSPMR